MNQLTVLIFPVIIFLVVTGIFLLANYFWKKYFAQRTRDVENQLSTIKNFRKNDENDFLKESNKSDNIIIAWLDNLFINNKKIYLLLVRSGSTKTPAEFILITLGLVLLGFVIGIVFGFSQIFNILLFALGLALIPWIYLSHLAKKRRSQFEDQLPEALDFISRSLRAGHGLVVAMGMVSEELQEPIAGEFKITFEQLNFGISFTDAMNNMAIRINSPDLSFFTVAVLIQQETGGNLTELLAGLAKTIRERMKLKGKVRILASEGKFSAYLLGALPFLIGIIFNILNPAYMELLWRTSQGINLVTTGLVMMFFGAIWMRAIVNIKV